MTEECRIDDRSTWESVWRACAKFCESRESERERGRKKRKEEATIVDNVVHRLSV